MTRMRWIGVLVSLVTSSAGAAVITNGDFSLGNVGFDTQYTYNAVSTVAESSYTVGTNPRNYHALAASYGDHTTGSGQMLLANGATTAGKYVWQQTLTLDPDTDYIFSVWVASWGLRTGNDPSPAVLQFVVDGIQVGANFNAPTPVGQWSQFEVKWNSGSNTTAILQIFDANTAATGNDFSLDDLQLSVAQAPEPGTLAILGLGLAGLAATRRRRQ